MEDKILLKNRLKKLEKIYKAGLKELDDILENQAGSVAENRVKKRKSRKTYVAKYDQIFASLITDSFG